MARTLTLGVEEKKVCKRCGKSKAVKFFHKAAQRKDGSWLRQNICKPCATVKAREYYLENQERLQEHNRVKAQRYRRENPERERWIHIRRKYGLSQQEWNSLLDLQLSRGAICSVSLVDIKICVDHDHTTGVVRGLLCTQCNFAIGYFHDDPERCESAARYLREQAKVVGEVMVNGD